MRTYNAKPGEIEQKWFIVDAADKPLGRIASEISTILQGKNKPTYTRHIDVGDYVVVMNAAKVKLTGNKMDGKLYHRHLESAAYRWGQRLATGCAQLGPGRRDRDRGPTVRLDAQQLDHL